MALTSQQVSVPTSKPVRLVSQTNKDRRVILCPRTNVSGATVYIGDVNVNSLTGFRLFYADSFNVSVRDEIWGIGSYAAGITVDVLTITDA